MEKKKINIIEVGPRDGYQSVRGDFIPTELKKEIIDLLVDAGVKHLEYTSFVSPKAIPQLADAAEVSEYVLSKYPDLDLMVLVPNMRGATNAHNLGVKKVCNVVSYSASHNKANINRTHEESLNAYREMVEAYPDMECVLDLATTFGCPFEGIPDLDKVLRFVERIRSCDVDTVYLADTIGIADPAQVRRTVKGIMERFPDTKMQVHIHDTRGMGLVNTLAAIEAGVDTVQSTLGGLGGCPFAPGASGNTATEDLVYMLQRMGYDTGIDFERLLVLSKEQHAEIDGIYSGHQMNIAAKSPCC